MYIVMLGCDLFDQVKVLVKYLCECFGGWLVGYYLMKSVCWDMLMELLLLDVFGWIWLLFFKFESKVYFKWLYLQKSWLELLEYMDMLLV